MDALGTVRGIDLHVEAIPARDAGGAGDGGVVSGDIVHAGDTVMVEATLRPWQQPAGMCEFRSSCRRGWARETCGCWFRMPGRWTGPWISRGCPAHSAELETVLAQARRQHPADRIYVSLLVPETQAGMAGVTLPSLPLSMANALEPLRTAQDVNLNGESAEVEAEAPAGGVLSGFQILNVRIESGGGLD